MSPPGRLNYNRTSAAVGRREWKAARRAALVQCDRCDCIGTGQVNGRGRLVSTNVATEIGTRPLRHLECQGRLVAFDIAEGS